VSGVRDGSDERVIRAERVSDVLLMAFGGQPEELAKFGRPVRRAGAMNEPRTKRAPLLVCAIGTRGPRC
jgi:hypothetical protein